MARSCKNEAVSRLVEEEPIVVKTFLKNTVSMDWTHSEKE